jgi:hypothetical protein
MAVGAIGVEQIAERAEFVVITRSKHASAIDGGKGNE